MLGVGILVISILVGDLMILGGNPEHVIDVEIDTFGAPMQTSIVVIRR